MSKFSVAGMYTFLSGDVTVRKLGFPKSGFLDKSYSMLFATKFQAYKTSCKIT